MKRRRKKKEEERKRRRMDLRESALPPEDLLEAVESHVDRRTAAHIHILAEPLLLRLMIEFLDLVVQLLSRKR